MRHFSILGGLILAAWVIAPAAAVAEDHRGEVRYYDRDGRDYHVWNSNEDRAYRFYLNDQHREYREWRTVRGPAQVEYFRWRHTHPDSVIFVAR